MKPKDLVLEGIRQGRVLTGPQTIHIDLVNACNTNCITCWDHSPHISKPRPSLWKRQRISQETVGGLLDDAMSLGGLRAVILSGMGEPFVHPEIYEMVAAVKQRGLHLTIITNLVLADPERVIALGVDQLLIGIHGASETSYLAFHPNFGPPEWQRLHEQLTIFAAAGKRFKHVHVICETNAFELPGMVELAARHEAASITFKLASLKEGTEAVRISDIQRGHLVREGVPQAMERATGLGVETNLDVFAMQLEAGIEATAPISDVGCFMGYAYARITVDETVLFCCSTEIEVGSLREHRFSDLWDGDLWNAVRTRLRRGEYFPGCSQCGKFNQNVSYRSRFEKKYGRDIALQVTGNPA